MIKMKITIFRLGHRLPRDERITTHVALVARAFGAEELIYAGQHDSSFEESVKRVSVAWGGAFSARHVKKPASLISEYKDNGYTIVHLTMYGIPLPEKVAEIRKSQKIAIIVGAEQVPKEFYELANFNISITSQPHSEVAALAITLEQIMEDRPLEREFSLKFKGKIAISPSERGKSIRKP